MQGDHRIDDECDNCCLCCFTCIHTKEVGIVENFGDFEKVIGPGLNFTLWPIQYVSKRISTRIQQLDVRCETKTKDNVFIEVAVAVQYRITDDDIMIVNEEDENTNEYENKNKNNGGIYAACYRLTNPTEQIQNYVFDVIRNTIPKLELDDVYVNKTTIAVAVKRQLSKVMQYYGYQIMNTLVVDLIPTDKKIINSMNEINASKRLKEATAYKAEANKIKMIKVAEAAAEAKYLQGYGTARQRKAIMQSLQVNVSEFMDEVNEEGVKKGEPTVDPKDVMDILLLSQYADTLKEAGSDTLFLTHDPSFVSSIRQPSTFVRPSKKNKQKN